VLVGDSYVTFSNDSRWLVTATREELRFWKTGSWEPAHVIARERATWPPGGLALTRDGKMLAVAHAHTQVQLRDPTTGRELASLVSPNAEVIQNLCFSADGSRLAASRDNEVVTVWDLREIRKELAAIGLDWDLTPYAPARDDYPGPLQAVSLYEGAGPIEDMARLGLMHLAVGRQQEAIALLEDAIELGKKCPQPLPVLTSARWPLITAYSKAGMYARAEPLIRGSLAEGKSNWGADDTKTADIMISLGNNLLHQRKWDEAEQFLRAGLAVLEKKAPDYWNTCNAKSILGGILLGQKKYAQAEPLSLAGYEGIRKDAAKEPAQYTPGSRGHALLIDALERLVQLYDAWDNNAEAAKWRKELEALKPPP
jgi:hypothetical protein